MDFKFCLSYPIVVMSHYPKPTGGWDYEIELRGFACTHIPVCASGFFPLLDGSPEGCCGGWVGADEKLGAVSGTTAAPSTASVAL